MPLTLSSRVQNIAPDSIAYADDLQLGIRANGEERTSFIDLAGNIYNAEIPEALNAATFTGLTAAANGLTPVGFYGYRYVYVAPDRYPLVDGGKSIGGSIAPRGNPSPILVVNMNVDLNYVNLTIPPNDRKDITEAWIFRTTNYTTSADATLAANAGLCFYVGKVTLTPGGASSSFQDTIPVVGVEQIEFDNFSAPTFKYCRYIPPYFWGIGNDQLVVPVQWEGKIVTITNSHFMWFSGRNGQFATLSGVTTGGIDGRGLFIFKAGDEAGFNEQSRAILTINGSTAQTLSPTTGTGFLVINGIGSILYRSKFRNPFAWGVTNVIGSSQQPEIYTIRVAAGQASALIGLPDDEQLKIDFKNPSACYMYNLRLADVPEFSTTRRKISDYSVGNHRSQFFATGSEGKKVIWGWDPDTFAILQSDGTYQIPMSEMVWKTLRAAVRDPFRIQFASGFCDEENQLNCICIPFQGEGNYEADYPASQYKQTSLIDLNIYQHYPSQKWGYNFEYDLTAAAQVRDLNVNKLKIIGGSDTGLLFYMNDNAKFDNLHYYGPFVPTSFDRTSSPNSLVFPAGTFSGVTNADLVGLWGFLYTKAFANARGQTFLRILSLTSDTLYFDMVMYPYDGGNITNIFNGFVNDPLLTDCKFAIGVIPKSFFKLFDFGNPTTLKRFLALYFKGQTLTTLQLHMSNFGASLDCDFDSNVKFTDAIWKSQELALALDTRITLQTLDASGNNIWMEGIGPKLNV